MTRIDPGIPNVLLGHGNRVFQRRDGRMVVGANVIADRETWEQLVSGYRCMQCFHVQSQPFPEQCEFEAHAVTEELGVVDYRCPMRIRDDQMRLLQEEFLGAEDFEPRDPHEVLDLEREDWVPTKTGIVVPRSTDAS